MLSLGVFLIFVPLCSFGLHSVIKERGENLEGEFVGSEEKNVRER